MKLRATAFTIALAGVLTSACVVGPNYVKPTLPTPETLRGSQPAAAESAIADAKWWDVYQDEQLQALIRTALAQNEDLRIAAARVLEVQAQLGITRADQYPAVAAQADAGAARSAATRNLPATTAGALRVGGTVDWALDFWGRYRRATEAARADLLSTEWGRRTVVTTVMSDVANAYFELRALDLQLDIAQRTLLSRRESLQLTQAREAGGVTSLLDVREAEQLVHGASATIADLERRIAQEENLINVLLGNFPSPIARGRELVNQPHPPEIPAGLPSSLLERRPDVQAAEQRVVSANAQIGVARAAYFPSISLTGTGGVQSAALGALFNPGAGFWTAIASATQPMLELIVAARTDKALRTPMRKIARRFQEGVKQAFREASDSLVGYTKAREFRVEQEALTTAAQDARRLAQVRYQGGATSYLEVLDAETRLFEAELSLVGARQAELSAFAEVYRALGGGWQQEGRPTS